MTAALAFEEEIGARRQYHPAFLNELANDPRIRPMCGGDGPLDFSAFVANPKNHALAWNHGAFLFLWTAPQTYEVHIMVSPEGRGREAYHMAHVGISYITAFGANHLWARVRKGDVALRHYTAQAGFEHCGTDVVDDVVYDLYQWRKRCH
jgi:hypothetical protein